MAKNRLIISILALLMVIILISIFSQASTGRKYILINNNKIFVEIADNENARRKGLSDRISLEDNGGMLFIFSQKGIYNFWMDKMKFNLDFVFINKNTIVDLYKNVPFPKSDEQPITVVAGKQFDRVLEINAGIIDKLNINVGDVVEEISR